MDRLLGRLVALPLVALSASAALQGARIAAALKRFRADPPATCFEHHPPRPRARVLVLGDSTGVGIGAGRSDAAVAGLLARDFPGAAVTNACRNGARVADVLAQVRSGVFGAEPFDLVLLHVGGNDVIRLTPASSLARDAEALLEALGGIGHRTIWLGSANVGLAPVFVPPFSWVLSARTRRASELFARLAAERGAEFVGFFYERGEDRFSARPEVYFAADRLHPSASSYAFCYREMLRRTPLRRWLAPAAARAG